MRLFVPGPTGRLEAILWEPVPGSPSEDGGDGEPRAAAVVCHPHPLHGGTMHNNVVFRIARGLRSAGLAVLRFNFRGVEASEGAHDEGRGEVEDARAALDFLAERYPDAPLWAAGFSFGSRVVATLASAGAGGDERIRQLLLITMPCLPYDCEAVLRVRPPTWILMAGADEFGSLADLKARFPELPEHVVLDQIDGVDHFFRGATPELERRVREQALQRLP
jgi:alpha/beta superfamily hydrolase